MGCLAQYKRQVIIYFWPMLLTLLLDPNMGAAYRAVGDAALVGLPIWIAVIWGSIWAMRQWMKYGNSGKAVVGLLVCALVTTVCWKYLMAVPLILLLVFT